MKVLIIGGVAGGASAAARLRRLDENAEIVILERGEYISFANCGLPYYVGGEIAQKSALVLQTPQSFYQRFHIDVRVKNEAVSIDRVNKSVLVRNVETGEKYTESYDKLLLSPGAEPILPSIEGTGLEGVFTLRTVPEAVEIREFVENKPVKQAVIVGGGYIGVEMAENLTRAGVKTTIVEMQDHLIAPLDFDMACHVHTYLQTKGVRILLNRAVQKIEQKDGQLTLSLSDGTLQADMVLLSAGVRPETKLAREAGLTLGGRGAIVTNEHMLTSDPNIYAVGDAVEVKDFVTGEKAYIPLAGPANKQGRVAADNIFGIPSVYSGTQGSSVLKIFDMTVAATGLNERAAKAAGLDYDKMFTASASHASYYPGSTVMPMKTIYEKGTGKILGVQIVGFDGVDKRCDVMAAAVRMGMTAHDLTQLELCYAPPFGSAKDPVNFVGYAIENVLSGKIKTFQWHEVADLPRDGSVTLLDVRTAGEYAQGHIDGFINIPVDELRERVGELDPTKPTYVHCLSGVRSYIACCVLMGHGFDCYNLSGGWKIYSAAVEGLAAADHGCYDPN